MANQPPSQGQRAQQRKQQSQTAERSPSAKPQDVPNVLSTPERSTPVNAKQSPAIKAGEQIATAGQGGERNLVIQWIAHTEVDGSPWYSYALSAYFEVKTLPSHGLEVIMEQVLYKKTYTGTGALRTQLIPVGLIGTKGRLIAHDTTTGETLEGPWTWYPLGSGGLGFFSRLWNAFKRSLWKSTD